MPGTCISLLKSIFLPITLVQVDHLAQRGRYVMSLSSTVHRCTLSAALNDLHYTRYYFY